MAKQTLEKGEAAAKLAAHEAQKAALTTVENLRDLNIALIEMAHANIGSAFDFARQAATAQTPADVVNLWSTHIPKQLHRLTEQTRELAELGQKLASQTTASITPDG
jgi:hypothetical protein